MSDPNQGWPGQPANPQPYGAEGQSGYGAPQQPQYGTQPAYPQQQQPQYGGTQPAYGAPQQSGYDAGYGAQPAYGAQGGYGAPGGGYGAPGGYGQPAQPGPNGLATAGLIFGILPLPLLGIIFSALGLSKAGKVGGTGRTKAIVGLILSIVWIIGGTAASFALAGDTKPKTGASATHTPTQTATGPVSNANDPGCVAFESRSDLAQKLTGDISDPVALKADLNEFITELKADEQKTKSPAVKAAMETWQADLEELVHDLDTSTPPAADLTTRVQDDGTAIDTACR